MKKDIVEYLLTNVNKQDLLKILLIGSNGVKSDFIEFQKDIDFVFITKKDIDSFNYLKSISSLAKSIILKFNMCINIYPINERFFIKERTVFLKNIKMRNEIIWTK